MDEDGEIRGETDVLTQLVDVITTHTTVVIVLLLALTAVFGVGITAIEYDTSLEQFGSQTAETAALEYATENFTTRDEANTTVTTVTVSGENVLTKESLLESLTLQRQLHANETVNATLTETSPIIGVENVVATGVIRERKADTLIARSADLEERGARLNATAAALQRDLEDIRDLQEEYEQLNTSSENGDISAETYRTRSRELEAALEDVRTRATADLENEQERSFNRSMASVRAVQAEISATEQALADGNISQTTHDRQMNRLDSDLKAAYTDGTVGVLNEEYDRLWNQQQELEAERDALESTEQPPLSEQIEAIESLNESAYERHLESILDDQNGPVGDLAATMLPSSYEPGSTRADERLLLIRQSHDTDTGERVGSADDRLVESQLTIQQLANDHDEATASESAVFGVGIVTEEIDRAIADSLRFVGPLALGVVLVSLTIAYRDPLEVGLGCVGIVTVLIWTFGFMGWAGIAFNQLFVAIPVVLIGLSIDYAIHVFMRHRECHTTETAAVPVRPAMSIALAGVGVALVWVTATTAIGFLSNLVSPIGPLREFGLVSTVGIISALLVFGGLIPAIKIELEERLEGRDIDRHRPALGTQEGVIQKALSVGSKAARAAPIVVLVVVVAMTAGSLYAAGTVGTSFEQEALLAEDPAWIDRVPVTTTDQEYQAKDGFTALNERFDYRDSQAQIVVTGDVTDGETLERIDAARTQAESTESADAPRTAGAHDRDPLTVMESVAETDNSFNASFQLADRTGDGVPNQNVEGLYDQLFEIDPNAASDVIYRTDEGEYESVRLLVSVRGDADGEQTTREMRAVAKTIDDGGTEPRWNATATGAPIVDHIVEASLLEAILESLAITLVAVVAFLTTAYALTGNGATLGVVTLFPVVLAVCWIVGTMAVLDIPFNVLTGTVASFTIGLGVAYNIHVSSRYTLELRRQETIDDALQTTMTGTGGALLGSVATTALGFSTLTLAFLPAVRQFGIVTALTIVYAFLASILVLPTLLVGWTRYFGQDLLHGHELVSEDTHTTDETTEQ
ncbi:MMPL family transporter [Natronorubrum thiooxidans]|uniref:Predicted exporter protein, RND superfamily n=1 Tax=Natronorubrum thiooxidans TaxID=308853 RepID=A0A1N7H5L1_9EURY|nr:MMPL family transporter [Natronorubrum thiooxidans]SIS20155.1 Predicted exporter protein, RND superfamily [Natronorubrum thiooxidans]